ncbi:MAG: hypothetical protein VKL39_24760 [Leptolyngbyaceae bacterium]|nr:hypothetical protein [Leptolyngbyaceae bacterium]
MNAPRMVARKASPHSCPAATAHARLRALIAVLLASAGVITANIVLVREQRLQQKAVPPLSRCFAARVLH